MHGIWLPLPWLLFNLCYNGTRLLSAQHLASFPAFYHSYHCMLEIGENINGMLLGQFAIKVLVVPLIFLFSNPNLNPCPTPNRGGRT